MFIIIWSGNGIMIQNCDVQENFGNGGFLW